MLQAKDPTMPEEKPKTVFDFTTEERIPAMPQWPVASRFKRVSQEWLHNCQTIQPCGE
jgi:hypothetical protein